MIKDVAFGQYYPTNSVVHRLDPRIKLLIMIAYVVLIFFVKSYIGYLMFAILVFTTAGIAKIPFKSLLRSIKAVLFLVIFVTLINVFFYKGTGEPLWKWWVLAVYTDGLVFSSKMALRLILLVLGPALLTYTTTPMELTNAIESLLSPLKLVKFPVHDLAVIMSIAMRMIPTLMDETDRITLAQKARGADLDTGNIFQRIKAMIPILVPLFVCAFRRADELALALESRCYDATPNRTTYRVLKLKPRDFVFLAMFIIFMAAIILDVVLPLYYPCDASWIEGFYDNAFFSLFEL